MNMKVKFYRHFNMSTFKNSLFRAIITYISESTPNRVGSNSDYFSAIGQDIFGEVLSALCSQYLVGRGTVFNFGRSLNFFPLRTFYLALHYTPAPIWTYFIYVK